MASQPESIPQSLGISKPLLKYVPCRVVAKEARSEFRKRAVGQNTKPCTGEKPRWKKVHMLLGWYVDNACRRKNKQTTHQLKGTKNAATERSSREPHPKHRF